MAKSKKAYKRLWLVIAHFGDGTWKPCDFADLPYTAINYYEARRMKRAIFSRLKAYDWKQSNFKIVEATWQKVRSA